MREQLLTAAAAAGCPLQAGIDVLPLTLQVSKGMQHSRVKSRSPIPLMLWPVSRLLAESLLAVPELLQNAEVLELGCGSHGVVARAALHAGAARVLATDADWEAVERTEASFARIEDHGSCKLQASVLNWDRPRACEALSGAERFSVLVGSDVLHEREHAAALLETVRCLMAPSGIAIIANAAARHRYGVSEFLELTQNDNELSMEVWPFAHDLTTHLGDLDEPDVVDMDYDLYCLRWRTPP
jgi:predicted nicotinamide N-methyase